MLLATLVYFCVPGAVGVCGSASCAALGLPGCCTPGITFGTGGSCSVNNCATSAQSTSSSCTGDDCYDDDEEEFDDIEAAVAVAGATLLAYIAAAPPPLPGMVPQGLPQPGAVSGGGGVLPSTALAVS